jgi:mannan endo-1,6-alpha-mannosidase
MVEVHCEAKKNCDPDQTSFKAFTARWLAVTTQLAPFTSSKIMPKLHDSAKGAAQQCSGGDDKTWCGQNWNTAEFDGFRGVGEQMSALAVIGATLMEKNEVQQPVTEDTGGTSKGDPTAGTTVRLPYYLPKLTTGDTIGASLLTAAVSIALFAMVIWINMKDELPVD